MGYDYSLGFLEKHKATVKQLVELAVSGEVIETPFESYVEMQATRLTVQNVLTSLSVNYPEQFKEMRKHVRTWQRRSEDGMWYLCVGAPKHKIRGAVPEVPPVLATRQQGYAGPPRVQQPADVRFDKLIEDEESWNAFMMHVAKLSTEEVTRTITAEFLDAPDNLAAFDVFRAIGWVPEMASPTTLLLRRANASTTQANA